MELKLSHEKLVHLSHMLLQALQSDGELRLIRESNEVRNRILLALRDEMRHDAEIEARVRRKISSQRRNIPEGSPEWDILFRKYYEEEMSGLRGS